MNCNEAVTLVAAYADSEIDGLRSDLLKKHLLGCASCTTQYRSLQALRARLRAELPYFQRHRRCARRCAPYWEPWARRYRSAGPRLTAGWLTGTLAGCTAPCSAWVLGTAIIGGARTTTSPSMPWRPTFGQRSTTI